MKRALVAILSLALIICLAIPALAAEDVVISLMLRMQKIL